MLRWGAPHPKLARRLIVLAVALASVPIWLRLQFPGYLGHLFDAIPGDLYGSPTIIGGAGQHYYGGDQVQILYLAWKLKQNLVHHWSLLTDHYTFAARTGVQHDLAFGPQLWLIAFISLFVGDVAAYNLGFVILPLSFMFLAAYYATGVATSSWWLRGALAAGLTILPLRLVELMMGHSTGSVCWLVPLYWGVVLRHHLQRGMRHGDAAAGAILFVTVIAEEHQGFYLLISSAMVFLVWGLQALSPLRSAHRALGRMIVRWKFLLVGVAAVALWGLVYQRLLLIDAAGHSRALRPEWDIKLYSQPLRYFLDIDGESNVGAWFVRVLPVAAVVLIVFRRRRIAELLRSPYLGLVVALPILLALTVGLGPDWSQQSGVYQWFYAHVPFFSAQRVAFKLFTVDATFLAILCAAAYAALADESRQDGSSGEPIARAARGIARALLITAVVVQPIQYARGMARRWPGVVLTDMRWGPRTLFFYLRTHLSRNDIVLTVPFNILKSRWETYPDYLAYRAKVRFADGYFGQHPAYFDRVAGEVAAFNDGAATPHARALARELGYTYLLLNLDQWPLPWSKELVRGRLDAADWLERLACDGDFCLYAFK